MLKFLFLIFFHPHFVSTTHIEINAEEKALQVSSEYFVDDFEKVLQIYNPKVKIDLIKKMPSERELKNFIATYLDTRFAIQLNQQNIPLNVLGFEIDKGKCILYLEGNLIAEMLTSCTIHNTIMGDNIHQVHLIFIKHNHTEQNIRLTHIKPSHTFSF